MSIRSAAVVLSLIGLVSTLPGAAEPIARGRMAPPGMAYMSDAAKDLLDRAAEERAPLPAEEVPYDGYVTEQLSYPTFDGRGRRSGSSDWRIVRGTGNSAENYLSSTSEGTLLDFGGEWLRVSRDEGRSWTQVVPEGELGELASLSTSGAEGAVAVAPNGDIVGVAWFVGYADLIVPFKYDAATGRWTHSVTRLGMVGFDRPSVAVLPGPFTVAGKEIPYISVLRGGFLSFKPTFYSLDGLTYTTPRNRALESLASQDVTGPLQVDKWAHLDWLQPHEQTGITPLGPGKVIAGRGLLDFRDELVPRSILDPATLRWSRYRFPEGGPREPEIEELVLQSDGRLLADSKGRLHHIQVTNEGREITYMMSRDGGANWTTRTFPILGGRTADPYYKSFRVSGRHDTSVLVIHAVEEDDPLVTRDLVYRFDSSGRVPALEKIYTLGSGDFGSWGEGTEAIPADAQMDFSSIALLPDARIAVSFTDRDHWSPSIAIELPRGTDAGPRATSRVVTREYTSGAEGVSSPGRYDFVTSINERSVRVEVEDAFGQPVSFTVFQTGPEGETPEATHVCGNEGTGEIPIRGGWDLTVWVNGSNACLVGGRPPLAVTGTITLTFKP